MKRQKRARKTKHKWVGFERIKVNQGGYINTE